MLNHKVLSVSKLPHMTGKKGLEAARTLPAAVSKRSGTAPGASRFHSGALDPALRPPRPHEVLPSQNVSKESCPRTCTFHFYINIMQTFNLPFDKDVPLLSELWSGLSSRLGLWGLGLSAGLTPRPNLTNSAVVSSSSRWGPS